MSQSSILLEEGDSSMDIFCDADSAANTTDDSIASTSGTIVEPIDNVPAWKGVPMDEICKGFSPFDFEHLPPISPSADHVVLIALPLPNRGPPTPHPSYKVDKWNQDHVRLPQSSHCLYPTNQEDGDAAGAQRFRRRWEVIQEALLQTFYTSRQLEIAILSYNYKYAKRWNFKALHYFFSKVTDKQESSLFFESLLPKIIRLALQLPTLLTGAIPLLKRHTNMSLTLSQLQVASLIANAFLCTFPRRNSSNPQSEYANYPQINFNRLFSTMKADQRNKCRSVMEKLKCIFHYFRRVTAKAPEGTITIQRRYIPKDDCPKWETSDAKLPLLYISSKGTIESEGAGLLQVDFANKYVGGGVMNWGCVQEEIRFVICPELLVTMLVTEALDDTESLTVCGVEQYSNYTGYSDTFKWCGDFVDETPRDCSGRRKTCIVAIDALYFRQPNIQFNLENITRELDKAYVGFCSKEMAPDNLCAIATGNWGCGAFRGNPKLKVLLQLMAAAIAKRSVVYFTFGDTDLRDSVADMYWFLVGQNINIGQLFDFLSQYQENSPKNHSDFYRFLYNKGRTKQTPKLENKFRFSPQFMWRESKRVDDSPKIIKSPQKLSTMSRKKKEDEAENLIRQWLEESDEEEQNGNISNTNEKKNKNKSATQEYMVCNEKKEESDSIEEKKNSTCVIDNCESKEFVSVNGEPGNNTSSYELGKGSRISAENKLKNQLSLSTDNRIVEDTDNSITILENRPISRVNKVESNKSKKNLSNSMKSKNQKKISDFFFPVR